MRKETIKANIVVFIASFCTLVIELVAGRIMAPFVGVSLYTWTSIIALDNYHFFRSLLCKGGFVCFFVPVLNDHTDIIQRRDST